MLAPIFGETYKKAQEADSKEEFIKSREAASTAALYGSTLAGSGIQTYAIAAVLNHCGVLSYKGAAYIGGLIFAATSVPPVYLPKPGKKIRRLTQGGGGSVGHSGLPGTPAGRAGGCQGCCQRCRDDWTVASFDLVGN